MVMSSRFTAVVLLAIGAHFGLRAIPASAQDRSPAAPANPPRGQAPAKNPGTTGQRPSAAAAAAGPAARQPTSAQPPSAAVRPGQSRPAPAQSTSDESAGPKLTAAEQAELNQVLVAWERESDKV